MKVDFWDTDEMADKILSVISSSSLVRLMAENGSKEVLSCTWAKAAKEISRLYLSL